MGTGTQKEEMKMLQKIKRCLLLALTIVMLVPAVSGFAVTPKQAALNAYSRWLSGSKVQVMPKGYRDYNDGELFAPVSASNTQFAIAYINNDSIPELIVRTVDGHYGSVLTYRNGKIVRLEYTDEVIGMVYGYYSKTGMYLNRRKWPDSISKDSYKLMGAAGVKERFEIYTWKSGAKEMFYYDRNGKSVTLRNHTEFRNKLLTFTKGKALTVYKFYRNTAANRKNILK